MSLLDDTDVIESCARERVKTKTNLYKLPKVIVLAALLKEVLLGCKDAVLPDAPMKQLFVKCLSFDENTRKPFNHNIGLFRTLTLHLQTSDTLGEDFSKKFNPSLKKLVRLIL